MRRRWMVVCRLSCFGFPEEDEGRGEEAEEGLVECGVGVLWRWWVGADR